MSLDEARERAERELEDLATAIEVHEHHASPDAVLNAYAASATLAGMIAFSEAVAQAARTWGQARESITYDLLPQLGRTLGKG